MTKADVVDLIAQALTSIDNRLSAPDADPSTGAWQQLFALRKHLDDQQRELVQEVLQGDTNQFNAIGSKLKAAADQLGAVAAGFAQVTKVLGIISSIAALLDQVLKLA